MPSLLLELVLSAAVLVLGTRAAVVAPQVDGSFNAVKDLRSGNVRIVSRDA